MLAVVEVSISVSELMPECVQRHTSYPLLTRPGFGHSSCQREQPYIAYSIKHGTRISAGKFPRRFEKIVKEGLLFPKLWNVFVIALTLRTRTITMQVGA